MNPYLDPSGVGIKTAFASAAVPLKLSTLRISRPLPAPALLSKKFYQVLASIAAVGLVEPVVVTAVGEPAESYRVLDGRLRLEALRRLDKDEALCLVTTDDEAPIGSHCAVGHRIHRASRHQECVLQTACS